MAAIITQSMRVRNAAAFKDIVDNENVYLYIGKSREWPSSDTVIDTPEDSLADARGVRQNMFAIKQVAASDVSHVVPRHNWASNTIYAEYDDADDSLGSRQFYVVTDELNVYKCLKAGSDLVAPSLRVSTVKPTGTNTTVNAETGDGYIWKYMFTLSGTQASKFLTNSYLPVNTLATDDGSIQYDVQDAAISGAIHRIKVTAGGTGYSSTPTVTISGTGTGATATASVSSGVITAINVTNIGSGYEQATVTITDSTGSGATARAVISPRGGHGSDPINELGGIFTMSNVTLDGDESTGGEADFLTDNEYRQLGLMINPLDNGGSSFAATTGRATYKLVYSNIAGGSFAVDDEISNGTGGVAFIDSVDSANSTLYYHQDEDTGYGTLTAGDTITVGAVTATIDSITDPDFDRFTGDILYIENRSAVDRAVDQIEDVKLVIEF
jgi:hypothetical protein